MTMHPYDGPTTTRGPGRTFLEFHRRSELWLCPNPECRAVIDAPPFAWRDCHHCGWVEGPQPAELDPAVPE